MKFYKRYCRLCYTFNCRKPTNEEGDMKVRLDAYLERTVDEEVAKVVIEIAETGKEISALVRKAGLAGILGSSGRINVQGEEVQKLDEIANEMLKEALTGRKEVSQIASEELEESITLKSSGLAVAYDPLDGSSNIDVNVSIGTIFSVHKDTVMKPGREQICAGYIIYGPSTCLVFSAGNGVSMFTLDTETGIFFMTSEKVTLKDKGKIYSINEANREKWLEDGMRKYIDFLKQEKYSLRYVGSMVADVHRTLLKGGIFIYPADKKNTNGKLRLLYEASPMAFLVEQAGGKGSTGKQRILDIVPESLHQRVPVAVGSKWEVEKLEEFLRE
jgi:fructose-1,6-bisphosphatase I